MSNKFGDKTVVVTPDGIGTIVNLKMDSDKWVYLVHIPSPTEVCLWQNSKHYSEDQLRHPTDEEYEDYINQGQKVTL